jgi:hypothetical protein
MKLSPKGRFQVIALNQAFKAKWQDKTVPVTSLQLVGPRLSEAALLNAGRLIEAKRSRPD